MRVELVRDWKQFHAGKVFTDCPPGKAEILVMRGIGRILLDATATTEPKRKRK